MSGKTRVKVMIFGTFDLLHPGHLNFMMQAKELGNQLIVSVARDINVFKVKGQKPMHGERLRLKNVSLLPIVDKAVLGGKRDPWAHIKKLKPDIIALGYDQKIYVKDQGSGSKGQSVILQEELRNHGLNKTKVIRLKPYWPQVYKSRIIRRDLGV